MNENSLIELIRRLALTAPSPALTAAPRPVTEPRPQGSGPHLIAGIGDDCAILRTTQDLVIGTDMLIENVHFRRDTHTAADAGWKALARGLSDLAAMGADPRWCLLSLALPPGISQSWIKRFYQGLLSHQVPLIGGDLAQAPQLVADIVVLGSVPKGKALRRGGAQPGDTIYVSGQLGGSALGLRTNRGRAAKRHRRPEPRLALGQWLRNRATACMDLSDGLSQDLSRLCRESQVSAAVDGPLPLFPGASLHDALHGGEDYELLFTTRRPLRAEPPLPITRIGTILRAGPPITYQGQPLQRLGWDHFERKETDSGPTARGQGG